MRGLSILYASQLVKGALSIWFISWAVRRRYQLDYELRRCEQTLRWLVVGVAFALALVPGATFSIGRVTAGILGVAFLAWPNLAHHTMNFAAQLNLKRFNREKKR